MGIFYIVNKNEIIESIMEAIAETNQQDLIASEISAEGNVQLFWVANGITQEEIFRFKNCDLIMYYIELKNKTAILESGAMQAEILINPSCYRDGRYDILKSKKEADLELYMFDSNKKDIIATRVVAMKGKVLDTLKKSLEINSQCSREEYEDWITNVLYKNLFSKNLKLAHYIGCCVDSKNEIVLT